MPENRDFSETICPFLFEIMALDVLLELAYLVKN